MNKSDNLVLFNSPLETGVRLLIILNTIYPQTIDLSSLTWLDYLIIHTEDVGGPPSLHPNIPQREGELLVRRKLIKTSIELMQKLHYVDYSIDNSGIRYKASEEIQSLLNLLHSKYSKALINRAEWLKNNICWNNPQKIKELVNPKIGPWDAEFQNDNQIGPTL